MKTIFIIFAIAVLAMAKDLTFDEWEKTNNVKFGDTQERSRREKIFNDNMKSINAHNANPDKTFTQGPNEFTHLSPAEFQNQFCGLKVPSNIADMRSFTIGEATPKLGGPVGNYTASNVPLSTDFKSVSFGIQNQGGCGSCW